MRVRSVGLAATVLLALASAPAPVSAQGLPSDVEERLGLPRNREYPPHVRREIMREYGESSRKSVPGVVTMTITMTVDGIAGAAMTTMTTDGAIDLLTESTAPSNDWGSTKFGAFAA